MKVISLEIPVKEVVQNIKIEWTRGDLTRGSKNMYRLSPESQICEVNEMFVKLSAFFRNPTTGKYQSKMMTISVSGETLGKDGIHPAPKFLGRLEMDLGAYVGQAW